MIRPPQQDNPDRKFSAQANLEIRPRAWGWGCGYDPAMYSVAWGEVRWVWSVKPRLGLGRVGGCTVRPSPANDLSPFSSIARVRGLILVTGYRNARRIGC